MSINFKLYRINVTYIMLIILVTFMLSCSKGKSPIYKITIKNAEFDDIATLLEAELSGANMNVFSPTLDIQAGMRSRGESFPKYKVYQFCNFTIGKEIFKVTRDFGAFIPCKIYMYEQGKDVVVGTYLASNAMKYLDIPAKGKEANIIKKNIKLIEDQIIGIINSLK